MTNTGLNVASLNAGHALIQPRRVKALMILLSNTSPLSRHLIACLSHGRCDGWQCAVLTFSVLIWLICNILIEVNWFCFYVGEFDEVQREFMTEYNFVKKEKENSKVKLIERFNAIRFYFLCNESWINLIACSVFFPSHTNGNKLKNNTTRRLKEFPSRYFIKPIGNGTFNGSLQHGDFD